MKTFFVALYLSVATLAYGRTIVETTVGPQVTVTVRRLDDASWSGRLRYQTFASDGTLVSDEEVPVGDIVSAADRSAVVDILNRVWAGLHVELAIPTPTPTPAM
ncbi:hypothetical protein UFOVP1287_63 [uncultured Caudovirales phage]|uniref:Uncharacterized protein n=1 Tax=uncultured Caudovirales phage TaxID=2100421 RepID=A0A6J5RJU3_9CAUD|nr:hypothetical protein UFOVP1287_63 [uncultured Caudovirales phage]CAB4205256.1 hypothetical protein UFOVP1408_50 [uncultured Caudovirales phage]